MKLRNKLLCEELRSGSSEGETVAEAVDDFIRAYEC